MVRYRRFHGRSHDDGSVSFVSYGLFGTLWLWLWRGPFGTFLIASIAGAYFTHSTGWGFIIGGVAVVCDLFTRAQRRQKAEAETRAAPESQHPLP